MRAETGGRVGWQAGGIYWTLRFDGPDVYAVGSNPTDMGVYEHLV